MTFHSITKRKEKKMIYLKPMTPEKFEKFKKESQQSYAENLASAEDISVEQALKSASEQFDKLVHSGTSTPGRAWTPPLRRRVATVNDA